MMGYDANDVRLMMDAIGLAKKSVSNQNTKILAGLDLAYEFFEGLMAEGRV